jgi:hypothetical protein
MNTPTIKNCKLCEKCGFLKDSPVGVLKESLGLLEVIEDQMIFPCHQTLLAYNSSHGKGKVENEGTLEMVEDTGVIEVCTGYVQSLVKSGIPPKNRAMSKLMWELESIDPRIMTIEETIKYHKGH